MYQQLLRGGGKDYTEKDITEIYNYVIEENQKYERMYEKNKCEDYLDKIRNIDIFDKYEFIKERWIYGKNGQMCFYWENRRFFMSL